MFSSVAPESLIVQVGSANRASEAVNVRDTVSALLASPSPFVAIDTGLSDKELEYIRKTFRHSEVENV